MRAVRSLRRSFGGVAQARARLLEAMRPQLAFSGWEQEEQQVAATAEASAQKVLSMSAIEVRSLAARMAAQGHQRCAHAALSAAIGEETPAVATAVFERQYARLLTQLVQERTDFWGRSTAAPAAQHASPLAARALSATSVSELLEKGLCVIDGVLDAAEVRAARQQLEQVHVAGELRASEAQRESRVRTDLVGWLEADELAARPALAPVVSLLRGLPAEVERHAAAAEVGGWRLAVPRLLQAALYDGSASSPSFYSRHLDCNDTASNPRRLTAILYLNPEWDDADGGCLRAYLRGGEVRGGEVRDVSPRGGRLLLFNSAEVEHEVVEARAPRMAVTLWAFGAN